MEFSQATPIDTMCCVGFLRRAVRYGRTLGFHEPFFYKLVAVVARTMGDVFPEIRKKQKHVEETLRREEEAFNKTLDRGIDDFRKERRVCAAMWSMTGNQPERFLARTTPTDSRSI